MFETEMFDEALTSQIKKRAWSVYADSIGEFGRSDKKTLKFKFKNTDDAKRGYQGIRSYVKRHGLNMVYYLRGLEVYLIKG